MLKIAITVFVPVRSLGTEREGSMRVLDRVMGMRMEPESSCQNVQAKKIEIVIFFRKFVKKNATRSP